MRLLFWKWAHDKAEQLWHWIYYAKLAPTQQKDSGTHHASVYFMNSKTGQLTSYDGTEIKSVSEPIE